MSPSRSNLITTSVILRYILPLAVIFLSSLCLYALYFVASPSTPPCRTQLSVPDRESLTIPGAVYLDPNVLLRQTGEESGIALEGIGRVGGIPRLIHQSWKNESLPYKFLEWSNSFRLRHPEWKWVGHPFALSLCSMLSV